jgi:site-specific recombinase XerC
MKPTQAPHCSKDAAEPASAHNPCGSACNAAVCKREWRHSFASHVLQSSSDLRGVQELLGHANISTTQVYTRLDFQHLAKAYDAAHPRAKAKAKPKG